MNFSTGWWPGAGWAAGASAVRGLGVCRAAWTMAVRGLGECGAAAVRSVASRVKISVIRLFPNLLVGAAAAKADG
jgi:hypothetical protein